MAAIIISKNDNVFILILKLYIIMCYIATFFEKIINNIFYRYRFKVYYYFFLIIISIFISYSEAKIFLEFLKSNFKQVIN